MELPLPPLSRPLIWPFRILHWSGSKPPSSNGIRLRHGCWRKPPIYSRDGCAAASSRMDVWPTRCSTRAAANDEQHGLVCLTRLRGASIRALDLPKAALDKCRTLETPELAAHPL